MAKNAPGGDRGDRAAKAAAALKAQQRAERRRRRIMIGSVCLALALIIGVGVLVARAVTKPAEVNATAAGQSDFGLTIGPADAPHKVVVYEDFLCPFCEMFESASREDLAQLAQDGKVQVDYRPFHLLSPDYSTEAASAFFAVLDISGPTVAKEFHDLLYENQPEETGPFPEVSSLVDLAVQAGASEDAVRSAIEDGTYDDQVTQATDDAKKAGVQGTPTIILDGTVYTDGQTVEEIAANLITAVS